MIIGALFAATVILSAIAGTKTAALIGRPSQSSTTNPTPIIRAEKSK